jgi:hypothetical protein
MISLYLFRHHSGHVDRLRGMVDMTYPYHEYQDEEKSADKRDGGEEKNV